MARKPLVPEVEAKVFESAEEIDRAIAKLQRRIKELESIDLAAAIDQHTGADGAAEGNLQSTILEIYGPRSPEYAQHQHIRLWAGPIFMGMSNHERLQAKIQGRTKTIGIINGLISVLKEKREDFDEEYGRLPSTNFDGLQLHPRISDVARDLFIDGHHFEAVFAAAKALINFVKERSGRHELDGASLMRTVFSKSNPILAFNALADQTDADQQEGLMHLFEGAVLSIRNPGGHSFPEGSEQRAIEYISLISLLAYLVQEARKTAVKRP